MRKVFDPKTVAHIWANQPQDEGRSQGNFFFEKETIYSYGRHFPIAIHYNNIVLFTNRGYSVSTAKHIRIVESASSHLSKVYCAYPDAAIQGNHDKNINVWIDNIKANVKKLINARKKSIYIDAINSEISEANKYIALFPKLKLNKEQKTALSFDTIETYISKYSESVKKELASKIAFEKQIQTVGKKIHDGYRLAWSNYAEKDYKDSLSSKNESLANAYNHTIDNNTTYIRTNGIEVETSKGIKLPVNVAKRYYNWFTGIAAKGGCNNCNYKILDYDVKQANESGLIVGCHNISIEEINRLADKLNWKR